MQQQGTVAHRALRNFVNTGVSLCILVWICGNVRVILAFIGTRKQSSLTRAMPSEDRAWLGARVVSRGTRRPFIIASTVCKLSFTFTLGSPHNQR